MGWHRPGDGDISGLEGWFGKVISWLWVGSVVAPCLSDIRHPDTRSSPSEPGHLRLILSPSNVEFVCGRFPPCTHCTLPTRGYSRATAHTVSVSFCHFPGAPLSPSASMNVIIGAGK